MNPTLKEYLVSSLNTALAVGSATLAIQLSSGPIQWTTTFWVTLALVVWRAVIKAVINGLSTQVNSSPVG